jgi:hypothetical protein
MVKTTVDLPDELAIAAKKRAAELRKPLRELIIAGLRSQLEPRAAARRPAARRLRFPIVKGGLPPGLDVSDRAQMHEWIRRQR